MSLKKETWGATILGLLLHPILLSFIAAIAIAFGLIFGVSSWLDKYTEHGHELTLPNLKGMSIAEASNTLAKDGLSYTVIDSMYSTSVAPGCVIDQVPSAGDKVKSGRKIYLYIRASHARQVQLPDFRDKSLRQYQGELEAAGLKIKDTRFVPSQYNTVIGVECNGQPISVGKKLTEGAQIVLKVGKGKTNELSEMPSLHGLALENAKSRIQALALNINVVFDVQPSCEDNKRFYKVWSQKPLAKSKINGDETVTIYVTTNTKKLAEPETTAEPNDD